MAVELLLAHADDHTPVLDGLSEDTAALGPQPGDGVRSRYYDPSGDPDSLPLQRWGLIVPEGPEGDRLAGLVAPLTRERQRQQDDNPVRVYRAPPVMSGPEAARWKSQVYNDESVAEEDQPFYLLILGDMDQVSVNLQRVLASSTAVGRLAFGDDKGYEAYVDKVLRFEREPPKGGARSLFYTVRDGTAATSIGYGALMTPAFERAQEGREKGDFKATEVVEIDGLDPSSIDALLEQAARPEPSVLFSMSHGLGTPRGGWKSVDEQRAIQGAMSLGAGRRLTGADMANRPFLPGGAWFFLACYGAGTPAESEYAHWLKMLKDAGMFPGRIEAVLNSLPKPGERPFVASLPKAVLANPDGPLSVIGHMDLAWTYSFQDMDKTVQDRPSRFHGIFKDFVRGKRAGLAHRHLLLFFADSSTTLAEVLAAEEAAAFRGAPIAEDAAYKTMKANLWMLRQDLGGYVLLGDPAARLPISPPPKRGQS